MCLTYIELEMYSSYSHSFPLFLKVFSQSQKQKVVSLSIYCCQINIVSLNSCKVSKSSRESLGSVSPVGCGRDVSSCDLC